MTDTNTQHTPFFLFILIDSKSCYFFLQNRIGSISHSVVPNSVRSHGLQPRLLCPWDFSGKDTGVGCHCLLQGSFLAQGSNPGLLELQADSLLTELPGKPEQNIVSLFHFMTSKSSSFGNTLLMREVLICPCSLPSSLQSLPRVYINVHDDYFLDQISRILNSRFSIYFNFFLSLFSVPFEFKFIE